MTFPLPLVRLAAFSGLVLAPCIASFNAPAQSSEAQFTDALKIFQRARGGDSGQIEPAIAVRDDAGRISIALKGRREKLAVSRVFAHLFKQM